MTFGKRSFGPRAMDLDGQAQRLANVIAKAGISRRPPAMARSPIFCAIPTGSTKLNHYILLEDHRQGASRAYRRRHVRSMGEARSSVIRRVPATYPDMTQEEALERWKLAGAHADRLDCARRREGSCRRIITAAPRLMPSAPHAAASLIPYPETFSRTFTGGWQRACGGH